MYFGDGEWDPAAAGGLGWRFIGAGQRLKGKFAEWIPDFASTRSIPDLQVFPVDSDG